MRYLFGFCAVFLAAVRVRARSMLGFVAAATILVAACNQVDDSPATEPSQFSANALQDFCIKEVFVFPRSWPTPPSSGRISLKRTAIAEPLARKGSSKPGIFSPMRLAPSRWMSSPSSTAC